MPEKFSPEERSRVMRAVKSVATEPEGLMRAMLCDLGVCCREQGADLPGRPDFINDELKLVFFVDGDWWHGRDWTERRAAPVNNADYWVPKFERNIRRDNQTNVRLRQMGWSVLRIWESDLRRAPAIVEKRIRQRVRRRARQFNGANYQPMLTRITENQSRGRSRTSTGYRSPAHSE